jgi:hypothetical protein
VGLNLRDVFAGVVAKADVRAETSVVRTVSEHIYEILGLSERVFDRGIECSRPVLRVFVRL